MSGSAHSNVENEFMAHPAVAEATVVGLKHVKWQERPAAFVIVAEGAEVTADELRDHLSDKVAKWRLPDEIVFVDEIPRTGTGKFDKKSLRIGPLSTEIEEKWASAEAVGEAR